jgi:predicted nucleic acid-binding protein
MRLILADTGVMSRYIMENEPFVNAILYAGSERFVISSITKIELIRWINGYRSQVGERKYKNILNKINRLPTIQIDRKISAISVDLSKHYLTKIPDLLIASTSLTHGIEIFTVNTKDFKPIKGVELYTPPNYSEIKKTL